MNNNNDELRNKQEISKVKTDELIKVVDQYNNSIKRINENLVKYFSSNEFKNTIAIFSDSVKSLQDRIIFTNSETYNSIKKITNYYNEVFSDYRNDLDNIKSILVNTAYLLSRSQETSMIKNIKSSFTDGEIYSLINTLNSSIKEEVMTASDISFFKVSHLVGGLDREIVYPKPCK